MNFINNRVSNRVDSFSTILFLSISIVRIRVIVVSVAVVVAIAVGRIVIVGVSVVVRGVIVVVIGLHLRNCCEKNNKRDEKEAEIPKYASTKIDQVQLTWRTS